MISKDGEVTYDSDANEGEMDNHGSRPEIEDAFKTGEGEAVRRSQTMDKNTFYYALRMDNGDVLRVAREAGSIWKMISEAVPRSWHLSRNFTAMCDTCLLSDEKPDFTD